MCLLWRHDWTKWETYPVTVFDENSYYNYKIVGSVSHEQAEEMATFRKHKQARKCKKCGLVKTKDI